ncbi:MAG: tail fiber domain-containing protein [Acidimicrobiales bacterium]
MSFPDNLGPLLTPPVEGAGLRFSQGRILSWDPNTFENLIEWKGITLSDLPVAAGVDALSFDIGDVVGMLGWNPTGGAGSWWILGRISQGPLSEPVAIRGGDLIVRDGASILVTNGEIRAVNTAIDIYTALIAGRIEFGDTDGTVAGQIESFLGGSIMDVTASSQVRVGAGAIQVICNQVNSGVLVSRGDTTSAANVNTPAVSGTTPQSLRHVTSARRFKVDIEDADIDPAAVLALRPRTWRDRVEVDEDPDTDRWHVGFVADEVDEAGLTQFVDYDETGEPFAITYDRLTAALFTLAQTQERRIADLEQRVAALDGGGSVVESAPVREPKPRRRPVTAQPDSEPSRLTPDTGEEPT